MSNVWSRFDDVATVDEVMEAKDRFTPVDAGIYNATIEKFEATESKAGLPKLAATFKLETGRLVFYNLMLQVLGYPDLTSQNISDALTFTEQVKGEVIDYVGLEDLADQINAIPDGGKYKIQVSYAAKDLDRKYPKVVILENLSVETTLPFDV